MTAWASLTAEDRTELLGYIRVAAADKSLGAYWPSVNLPAPWWAAIAEALSTLDAIGPAFADVARWDWDHAEMCNHGNCPDGDCDGTSEACEAEGRPCDCSARDVAALLALIRPLVKPPAPGSP